MRPIDADKLKCGATNYDEEGCRIWYERDIDNAPTLPNEYMRGYEAAEREYKRPTGKWIFDGVCFSTTKYKCSICHYPELEKTNYCPTCGARMEV